MGLIDARFFPPPSSIVHTFGALVASGELWTNLLASLRRQLVQLAQGRHRHGWGFGGPVQEAPRQGSRLLDVAAGKGQACPAERGRAAFCFQCLDVDLGQPPVLLGQRQLEA